MRLIVILVCTAVVPLGAAASNDKMVVPSVVGPMPTASFLDSPEGGRRLGYPIAHTHAVSQPVFSPDASVVAHPLKDEIWLVDVNTAKRLHRVALPSSNHYKLHVGQRGKTLWISLENQRAWSYYLWREGSRLQPLSPFFQGAHPWFAELRQHTNGYVMVWASKGEVVTVDEQGQVTTRSLPSGYKLEDVDLRRQRYLLRRQRDENEAVWLWDTKKPPQHFLDKTTRARFSPDGSHVLTVTDETTGVYYHYVMTLRGLNKKVFASTQVVGRENSSCFVGDGVATTAGQRNDDVLFLRSSGMTTYIVQGASSRMACHGNSIIFPGCCALELPTGKLTPLLFSPGSHLQFRDGSIVSRTRGSAGVAFHAGDGSLLERAPKASEKGKRSIAEPGEAARLQLGKGRHLVHRSKYAPGTDEVFLEVKDKKKWTASAAHFGGQQLSELHLSGSGRYGALEVDLLEKVPRLAIFRVDNGTVVGQVAIAEAETRKNDWKWAGERLFVAWNDGTVSAHSPKGKLLFRRKAHLRNPQLAVDNHGQALSWGEEGTVVVWDR